MSGAAPGRVAPGARPGPVTVENWQDPAVLSWSYQHVDQVLATAGIARRAPAVPLPAAPVDLGDLPVRLGTGEATTVAGVVAGSHTDGWMVLKDGRVVVEQYFHEMTPTTPHLLQSVSKSLVATVAGALVGRGVLDPAAPVSEYVPDLAGSGYAGATVRHVLDMRSGVRFVEDYFRPDSDSRVLEATGGWAPLPTSGGPRTIKQMLVGLQQGRPHGGAFEYRSSETDVLGWVCEQAAGLPFWQLASDLLWQHLGARSDALITVDAEGTGMFDGGICATVGDLARFGATLLGGGRSLTGRQVVPAQWVDDVFTGGPDSARAFAETTDDTPVPMPGGRYRSCFWSPSARRDVALCIGIHGQLVYLDRATGVVGVKLSSWPQPADGPALAAALAMFEAISAFLGTRAG